MSRSRGKGYVAGLDAMNTWVALLRGVNVSGKNRLPMQPWAAGLESLGCHDVRTYIQSGNAVFRSAHRDAKRLCRAIGDQIEAQHGFRPHVWALAAGEFADLIAANPFPEAAADPKSLHLFVLDAAPAAPNLEALANAQASSERWELRNQGFYLHAPDGIGRSKLAAGVERWLAVRATARNWRTVENLGRMCGAG